MKTIYILLTRSGTLLSNLVYAVTGANYTHASLAFDEDLSCLYSSTRKNGYTMFPAGPSREYLNRGVFRLRENVPCALYALDVSDEAYTRARRRAEHMMAHGSLYQFNVIGLALCGMHIRWKRRRHYFCSQFVSEVLEKSGAMGRTVMFIHTASDPTVECTLVPDMALAVAEQFALAGKRVLVLLTDMTNYADAQKEMAITMEQVPSNRGYPGDLYSCLAARYEKAVDFEGAGSITILGVTTMPGDDVTHPVPDNTGYITEGQYYLKNGHIEPFGSLSRLKQNVNDKTRSDHRALMDGMIRLYSAYKESLEKKSMGFMMSEWDEKLLKYGHLFETKLMDLSVNIPLEEALDLGWEILAECFEPNETGLKTSLIQERWPKRSAVE